MSKLALAAKVDRACPESRASIDRADSGVINNVGSMLTMSEEEMCDSRNEELGRTSISKSEELKASRSNSSFAVNVCEAVRFLKSQSQRDVNRFPIFTYRLLWKPLCVNDRTIRC